MALEASLAAPSPLKYALRFFPVPWPRRLAPRYTV